MHRNAKKSETARSLKRAAELGEYADRFGADAFAIRRIRAGRVDGRLSVARNSTTNSGCR